MIYFRGIFADQYLQYVRGATWQIMNACECNGKNIFMGWNIHLFAIARMKIFIICFICFFLEELALEIS